MAEESLQIPISIFKRIIKMSIEKGYDIAAQGSSVYNSLDSHTSEHLSTVFIEMIRQGVDPTSPAKPKSKGGE